MPQVNEISWVYYSFFIFILFNLIFMLENYYLIFYSSSLKMKNLMFFSFTL